MPPSPNQSRADGLTGTNAIVRGGVLYALSRALDSRTADTRRCVKAAARHLDARAAQFPQMERGESGCRNASKAGGAQVRTMRSHVVRLEREDSDGAAYRSPRRSRRRGTTPGEEPKLDDWLRNPAWRVLRAGFAQQESGDGPRGCGVWVEGWVAAVV
jgi:hypothetical protein